MAGGGPLQSRFMVMGVLGLAQRKGSRQSPSPHLSQVASSPDLGGGGEPLQGWEIRRGGAIGGHHERSAYVGTSRVPGLGSPGALGALWVLRS